MLRNSRVVFWSAFFVVAASGLIMALLVTLLLGALGFEKLAVPVGLLDLVMNLWAALTLVYWTSSAAVPICAGKCGVQLYSYEQGYRMGHECELPKGHTGAHA